MLLSLLNLGRDCGRGTRSSGQWLLLLRLRLFRALPLCQELELRRSVLVLLVTSVTWEFLVCLVIDSSVRHDPPHETINSSLTPLIIAGTTRLHSASKNEL
jgi:hypothetical protein